MAFASLSPLSVPISFLARRLGQSGKSIAVAAKNRSSDPSSPGRMTAVNLDTSWLHCADVLICRVSRPSDLHSSCRTRSRVTPIF
jgi:hypothetical protein